MKIGRFGIAAGALILALGCTPSSSATEDALKEARAACALNFPPPQRNADAQTHTKIADSLNPNIEHAKLAAQKDRQWDELAQALIDIQKISRLQAITRAPGQNPDTVRSADSEVGELLMGMPVVTFSRECDEAKAG
ncbi:hypothetical protein [Streptomyces sp. NPDC047981]|uniref:hypothetical protein n=1 Tax=Streptomyces sp. NPDC047981 TaxID=3154610 RepID=UPI00341485DB